MINNRELPIGFTMELAQHSDELIRFSNMTERMDREGNNPLSKHLPEILDKKINRSMVDLSSETLAESYLI